MSTIATTTNSIESAHDILRHTSRRPLDPIFSPKSVAVIGATETLNSVGRTILENLIKGGFAGKIFPVNPKRPTVLGIQAYPSITDVPEKPDLAIIITPQA
jgi:acetyltransferase